MKHSNDIKENTGIHILIIDDEESLRNVLEELLSDEGHQVTTAANGEEALALFEHARHPLVLADIRLPDISGLEVVEKLKALEPDTQAIIMTSYASLHSAVNALRAEAVDYLIKPFDQFEVVTGVIDRTVEKIRLIHDNKLLISRLNKHNGELERVNRVLQELAVKDGLTGLYNHRYFHEAIAIEHARARRHQREYSLLFIDIDRFKLYNDTHGHPQGDELLKEIADILSRRLRQSDTAARYGGEEFVLILPETTKDGALALADKLRQAISEHPFSGRESQADGKITVSIGVANFPKDGDQPHILIDEADKALFRAKKLGRNTVA